METIKEATGSQMRTLKEAAAELRVSHLTLRRPAWLVRLGAVRVGRKYLVPADNITAVLTGERK